MAGTTRSRYLCYGDYREFWFYSFFFLRRDSLGHIEKLFGVKSEQIRFRTKVSFEYKVSNGAFSSDLYCGWADALCYMFNKYWGVNPELNLSIFYIIRRVNNVVIADFYFNYSDNPRFEAFLLAFSQARVGIFIDPQDRDGQMRTVFGLLADVLCCGLVESDFKLSGVDFNDGSLIDLSSGAHVFGGDVIAYSLQIGLRRLNAVTLKRVIADGEQMLSFGSFGGKTYLALLNNYMDSIDLKSVDWSDSSVMHRVDTPALFDSIPSEPD